VKHCRLLVHRLEVDSTDVAVRLGTLVVVRRPGSEHLDWEVVAQTTGDSTAELGENLLGMTVVSGADPNGVPELSELSGNAVVARYVDEAVVWRGNGVLVGFDDDWLA